VPENKAVGVYKPDLPASGSKWLDDTTADNFGKGEFAAGLPYRPAFDPAPNFDDVMQGDRAITNYGDL
jgi:hypothetical protein